MYELCRWLEQTALGVWVRESPSLLAFPSVLFLHTLGLAMLVGVNAALLLWLLALNRRLPAAGARAFTQVMWAGLGVNAVSGVMLLLAYPAKALTNPIFYLKLALIAAALVSFARLKPHAFVSPGSDAPGRPARALAVAALLCWAGGIFTGRFLAYTHSVLMASELAP